MTNAISEFVDYKRDCFETALEIMKYRENFKASKQDIEDLFDLSDKIYKYIYDNGADKKKEEMIFEN